MTRSPHGMRSVGALFAAGLLAVALGGPGRAADAVVILLPKAGKDWEKGITKHLEASGFKDVLTTGNKPPKVRFEVGDSVRDVKDWNFVLQFKTPVAGGRAIPFVLHYRDDDKDARPVELLKGQTSLRQQEVTGDPFLGLGELTGEMYRLLPPKVFAGAGVPNGPGGRTWYRATKGKDKDGEYVEFRLHNRLPVTVAVNFQARQKIVQAAGDDYLVIPKDDTIVLEAGEERAYRIDAAVFADKFVPAWFAVDSMWIVDSRLAARPDEK